MLSRMTDPATKLDSYLFKCVGDTFVPYDTVASVPECLPLRTIKTPASNGTAGEIGVFSVLCLHRLLVFFTHNRYKLGIVVSRALLICGNDGAA